MSFGVENGPYIGVPAAGVEERPPIDARFYFRYLNDDRVEFYHPFHGRTTVGDHTDIEHPAVDAAAAVLFKEMPYLIDSKKLNRPAEFETRMYASEFAELGHCGSAWGFSYGSRGWPYGWHRRLL